MTKPHVLLFFLDGVGIGRKRHNPFHAAPLPAWKAILGGKIPHLGSGSRSGPSGSMVPINATLGVEGLPQSGTGQTALLTGVNASRLIGKHFGPYPYSTLRPVIKDENIFHKLERGGKKISYANAFPQRYFDVMSSRRMTAITFSWLSTGRPLNNSQNLSAGKALSADLTNEAWPRLGHADVSPISLRQAGHRLIQFTREYDFTLFEYYFTDHAGHRQSMEEAVGILQKLDILFEAILEEFDYERMLFVLTSDHGNMEDLSTKSHTRNPVPLAGFGASHGALTRSARTIAHVTPLLLKLLL